MKDNTISPMPFLPEIAAQFPAYGDSEFVFTPHSL